MKKVVLFIVLLLLPIVSAQTQEYGNVSALVVSINISSAIQKQSGTLHELRTSVGFIPQAFEHQALLSQTFTADPSAEISTEENAVVYDWNVDSDTYQYQAYSLVETQHNLVKISDKIPFPASVDADVATYTLPHDLIDINDDIEALASQIVDGEDDTYKIAYKLANWTQVNVAYNLSTLTAEAVQPSSWVLEHREGVCDELTNLFISLARSEGIPARFVSGLVYTNANNTFGNHGWAEAYIDGQWIPFDVTFGTLGWVDPSHIKFREELGSNTAAVSYEWAGKGATIKSSAPDIETHILSSDTKTLSYVTVSIEPLNDAVGKGSYVPVQVTVQNTQPYYVPVKLILTKAPSVLESNVRTMLLEPYETASLFWIVQVPFDTEPGYIYTTLLEVQTMYGDVATNSFTYGYGYDVISQDDAEQAISTLSESDEKPYLDDVAIDCETEKVAYYENETATVTCQLSGTLAGTTACFLSSCADATETMTWTLPLEGYTSQRMVISAEREGRERYTYFDVHIVTIPYVDVRNISPQVIGFDDTGTLSFTLHSTGEVKNLLVSLDHYGDFVSDSFDGDIDVSIPIIGRQFLTEEIQFTISYEDELGGSYSYTITKPITVTDIPWYYKALRFISGLFKGSF